MNACATEISGPACALALLSKGAELNTTAIASKGAIQFHT